MTRFFVKTELQTTVKRLVNCLESENYTYRINDCGTVSCKMMRIDADKNRVLVTSYEQTVLRFFADYCTKYG